tara:strand:- start:2181 stop:2735 length:555 start_codon:yes stop_codon:yes gene_type:complete
MTLENYQQELRRAYVRGGPGAIISGGVWFAAALMAMYSSISDGFFLLFFAGMFIFPASKLVLKLFFQRAPESKSNPGGLIALETVFPMIGGLFAAWLLLPHRPDLVFSVSAIAVGTHYFGFRTAYGDWTYWVFGAALCIIGISSIVLTIPSANLVPFVVALVEIAFGVWLIVADRMAAISEGAT